MSGFDDSEKLTQSELSELPPLKIKTNSISDDYEVEWCAKLGFGITGPVRPCRHRASGRRYALKCLVDKDKALQEVHLHYRCCNHEHVVKIYDVYSNDVRFPTETHARTRILIVLELMEGGELFDRISRQKCFTELQASQYTRQDAVVKLSDFGFAKLDDGNLTTPKFMPYYVAPQVLEAQRRNARGADNFPPGHYYTYDKSCDMWSVGVIVYIMLCGYPPFYSEQPTQQISAAMKRRIMAGQYEFPSDDWSHISPDAIDLVSRLLKVDPEKRLTASEVLEHPWILRAPSTILLSAAILSDKISFDEAKAEHSHQLTTLRLPDAPVTLKPFVKLNNALLKKRHRTDNNQQQTEVTNKSSKMAAENEEEISCDCD